MKEMITEVTATSINTQQLPTSTDDVISQYENKLIKSISSKTLNIPKNLTSSVEFWQNFTKEEMAYLAKKAKEESSFSEIKVITPDPTITLKKGNTEINIKNAATLVKKMEEIYPKGMTEDVVVRRPDDSTYQDFKKRVNFPAKNVSPEIKNSVAFDESVQVPFSSTFEKSTEKTVNKNAYEIRESILSMALDFFKWQVETKCNIDKQNGLIVDGSTLKLTSDEVLTTANKFYKFVENRK